MGGPSDDDATRDGTPAALPAGDDADVMAVGASETANCKTADFDYPLDPSLIAQTPAERGASRLLRLTGEDLEHTRFDRFPDLLRPGDRLVVNNTRVLPARLLGRRRGGGRAELLLVELQTETTWKCLVRPRRRLPPGATIILAPDFHGTVAEHLPGGTATVRFSEDPLPRLESLGRTPLPPYIRRPRDPEKSTEREDRNRYQTVYASRPGAVAAPTAGLHFTQDILRTLAERGVERSEITLHVGPGTFAPVTAEEIDAHTMHSETYEIPAAAAAEIQATRAAGGRIVAAGTTVVRTLESVALGNRGRVVAGRGRTDLFIRPGFDFQAVDVLLTNFHLPRSTLLMLVCAFGGFEAVLNAYRAATEAGYRFFSYGDAMLLERAATGRRERPGAG